MGLVDLARARVEERVPELAGRTAGAADLARLMAQNAYPQVTPFAHVVPGGISAARGEVVTGYHEQSLGRQVSVFLTIRSGDATGARALARIDAFLDEVIETVAGWTPVEDGDAFELLRAELAAAEGGAFVWRIDFQLPDVLRIAT